MSLLPLLDTSTGRASDSSQRPSQSSKRDPAESETTAFATLLASTLAPTASAPKLPPPPRAVGSERAREPVRAEPERVEPRRREEPRDVEASHERREQVARADRNAERSTDRPVRDDDSRPRAVEGSRPRERETSASDTKVRDGDSQASSKADASSKREAAENDQPTDAAETSSTADSATSDTTQNGDGPPSASSSISSAASTSSTSSSAASMATTAATQPASHVGASKTTSTPANTISSTPTTFRTVASPAVGTATTVTDSDGELEAAVGLDASASEAGSGVELSTEFEATSSPSLRARTAQVAATAETAASPKPVPATAPAPASFAPGMGLTAPTGESTTATRDVATPSSRPSAAAHAEIEAAVHETPENDMLDVADGNEVTPANAPIDDMIEADAGFRQNSSDGRSGAERHAYATAPRIAGPSSAAPVARARPLPTVDPQALKETIENHLGRLRPIPEGGARVRVNFGELGEVELRIRPGADGKYELELSTQDSHAAKVLAREQASLQEHLRVDGRSVDVSVRNDNPAAMADGHERRDPSQAHLYGGQSHDGRSAQQGSASGRSPVNQGSSEATGPSRARSAGSPSNSLVDALA